MSSALVAAAAIGLWTTSTGDSELATTDTPTSTTPATNPELVSSSSTGTPTTTVAPVPTSEGWDPIAPDPRGAVLYPSVVWADGTAIVVGGRDLDGNPILGAAEYAPTKDSWELIADPPGAAGSPNRANALSVWTGNEMLVLGGDLPDGSPVASYGLAYDPSTNRWRVTATPPGSVNDRSPWVWDGTELLVWPWDAGGSTVAPLAYDPASDAWRELAEPPVQRRQQAASVWTGTEWLIWGGTDSGVEVGDGVAYNPSSNSWRVMADSPLSARRVRGAWTGTEMIVAAGSSGGDPVTGNGELAHGDGAAYDPATDTWRPIADGPAHPGFEPVWTGRELLMFAKGGVVSYDPTADRWSDNCCGTSGGVGGTPVWTGTAALLIGSDDPSTGGVAYKPSEPSAPSDASSFDPTERADCAWMLEPSFDGGVMGNQGTFFALRNAGTASCVTPTLQSVTAERAEGSTVVADLRQTYFPLEPPPTDVAPDSAVTIVIASSNAGPCGTTRAEVDQLTILLSDGTTFEVPLTDPIEVSCQFAADIGVQ
jgi:hypothetical protein